MHAHNFTQIRRIHVEQSPSTCYASGVSKIHHQTTLVSNGSKSTIFLSHDVESVGLMTSSPVLQSKKDSKDQDSIQSSTTPSQDTKWESNTIIINITNKSQEVSTFPSGDLPRLFLTLHIWLDGRGFIEMNKTMSVLYNII